jgi:methionine synthase II (cobalamin-independent)
MANLYRADQVGSLLRPAELVEARHAHAAPDELRALEDRHIVRLLARQRALGLDVVTDGELRRKNFMSDLTDAVDGFDTDDAVARSWKADGAPQDARPKVSSVTGVVTQKLVQRRALTATELPFLQASTTPCKVTLPSATQFPAIAWKRGVTDRIYPTPSELLWDITAIIEAEMAALAAAGVPYLQIDAPRYSYYIDPKWRAWLTSELGVDPDAALDEAIRADNACFDAARRPGVTVAIHLCRGNNRSHWYAEGGYDAIAEKLFAELRVDRFLLEYDDERSGTFEPLRFVPRGKLVVLGLVSSKLAALEPVDALRRRIDDAARHVPLDELALSPQCGFASTMEGNLVTEDDQWAKLARVVETARAVWGT